MADNSTAQELYRAAVEFHDITRLAEPHIKPKGQEQPAVADLVKIIGLEHKNLAF